MIRIPPEHLENASYLEAEDTLFAGEVEADQLFEIIKPQIL